MVGVVEIVAGLSSLVAPRFGGLLVAAWLGGIIVNLLLVGGYGDIALRDFGLLLGALTLSRLASAYPPARARRPPGGSSSRGSGRAAGVSRGTFRRDPWATERSPMPATEPPRPHSPTGSPRRSASASPTSPARSPSSRSSARAPRLEYVSFADGSARGVAIKELDGGASVNDLLVAQPDRRAGAALRGRGGPRRAAEPHLRRVRARRAPGAAARAGQLRRGRAAGTARATARRSRPRRRRPTRRCGGMKNARRARRRSRRARRARDAGRGLGRGRRQVRAHGASPRRPARCMTSSSDRRDRLRGVRGAIELHDGQVGALAAIGGPLRGARPRQPPRRRSPRCTARSCRATRSTRSRPRRRAAPAAPVARRGVPRRRRSARPRLASTTASASAATCASREPACGGAGLVAGDELVQLTAFADEPGGPAPRARVRRPSRRRSAGRVGRPS